MKKSFLLIAIFLQIGCGKSFSAAVTNTLGTVSNGIANTEAQPTLADPNVMAVNVGCGYANEPCVTVTICVPGTGQCQSIPNVLLDTGSYGLRLFHSAVSSLPLTNVTQSGGTLAECQSYLDNSSDWGPVATADVVMGSERASNVRIQIIQSGFPGLPSGCTDPDDSPANTGFNGILGVGLFVDDCGPGCATTAQNETYYSCTGSTCTNVAVAEADQVSNPVAFLPSDNNGVALELPNVPDIGATGAGGYLILGIGTRPNNTSVSGTMLAADGNGDFGTNFQGSNYDSSFIDSGSNGLFFPQPSSLSTCGSSSGADGWFCPSSEISFSAAQYGSNGASAFLNFSISNAQVLLDSGNSVFSNLGAPGSFGFDWGLPFFLGRTVFVGIDGRSSSFGTGPYWAF